MVTRILPSIEDRPEWLTITPEQAEKARRIITREFWQEDYPFDKPAYQEIGFPFVAGQITQPNIDRILDSDEYTALESGRMRERFDRKWKIGFPDASILDRENLVTIHNSKAPEFLAGAFKQMMICDFFIYGQRNLQWKFEVDIARLEKSEVQRPNAKSKYHIDFFDIDGQGRADPYLVGNMAKAIRIGELICLGDGQPMMRGIHRLYVASSKFASEFPGHHFNAWDIIHFEVEPHCSPRVPETCTRLFVHGTARPLA
jgi:hypothetical protein